MISRSPDWVGARVGEEIIMMNVEHGRYIGLTETGALIWDLIEEPRSVDFLCAELCREYEISPSDCRAEVDQFLTEMAQQRVLVVGAS